MSVQESTEGTALPAACFLCQVLVVIGWSFPEPTSHMAILETHLLILKNLLYQLIKINDISFTLLFIDYFLI